MQDVYYLVSGTCHRKAITEKGDEIIYGIKESSPDLKLTPETVKSVVGVLVLYSDGISNHNFCASSKCCCYRIPRDVFLQYAHSNPAILTELLHMALREQRSLSAFFQARQEGKIANLLCSLLMKNAAAATGSPRVVKGLSNLMISQFLGVHKVTVARILRVLKAEGIIGKTREGIIILDAKRLTEYAQAGGRQIEY